MSNFHCNYRHFFVQCLSTLKIFILKSAAFIHDEEAVMSEKSFAVASVSVAIIWGTFFYPPMPRAAKHAAAVQNLAEPGAEQSSQKSARPAGPLVLLSAASHTAAGKATGNDCAIARIHGAADCAPLHKLASD